jgi:hypothetical protein
LWTKHGRREVENGYRVIMRLACVHACMRGRRAAWLAWSF